MKIRIAHWAKQAPYAHFHWQFPKYRYNLIREFDFGKFSVFIGEVNEMRIMKSK
jgi:hypothetical protein